MLRKQNTQISQMCPKITLKIELRGKEDVGHGLYTWFSIAIISRLLLKVFCTLHTKSHHP